MICSLAFLRTTAASFLAPYRDQGGVVFQSPWNDLAKLEAHYRALVDGNRSTELPAALPPWFHLLQHRLLVFLTIWSGIMNEGTSTHPLTAELWTHMQYTKQAVFDYVRREIEPVENGGEWAARVRDSILGMWRVTETSFP